MIINVPHSMIIMVVAVEVEVFLLLILNIDGENINVTCLFDIFISDVMCYIVNVDVKDTLT